MQIICAQSGIAPMGLPGFGIKDIADAGFEAVSLDMSLLYPTAEFRNIWKSGNIQNKKNSKIWINPEYMEKEIRLILKKYEEYSLKIELVRAPFFLHEIEFFEFLIQEYKSGNNSLLKLLLKINVECINLCKKFACRYIVVPPVCYHFSDQIGQRINEEYYYLLADAAEKNNVMILLENQYLDFNGNLIRGAFSDGIRTAEFIDKLNAKVGKKLFGFCLDTGVCNICGQGMREYILSLRNHIKSVIVRECDGQYDESLLPFTCACHGRSKVDWLGFIRGLREITYDGQLVFDIKDTASAFRPLLLLPLLKLAKTIADYFLWQIEMEKRLKKYDSIILFGAGNMCRDYMKCYGDKYPPMFICDNNMKRWGTLFCGLEIKSPEALYDVSDNYGVFICNMYYTEISEQLKNLGVRNIEFFNNVYMPSFYFDNLEMWKDDNNRGTNKGCDK